MILWQRITIAATIALASLTARAEILPSLRIKLGGAPLSTAWASVMSEKADALFLDDCTSRTVQCGSLRATLTAIVRSSKGQPAYGIAYSINSGVNAALRYVPDNIAYGVPDRWSTVRETLASGRGDCEEYAILKMWMLIAAGFDRKDIRFQLVRITATSEDHAVLLVSIAGNEVILDNLSKSIDEPAMMYTPLLSFVDMDTFIYGSKAKQ